MITDSLTPTPDFFKQAFETHRATRKKTTLFGLDVDIPVFCLTGFYRGLQALVFSIDGEIPNIDSSKAISVEVQTRPEGQGKYLYLVLNDTKFTDLFYKFCSDAVICMADKTTEKEGLDAFVERYEAWTQFWKRKKGDMTLEEVRGIVGELCYIDTMLDKGSNPLELIRAWHGVKGFDQDFVFNDSWVEVKTIRQSASEVEISSLTQLFNPSFMEDGEIARGELVVIKLHNDPIGPEAFNLVELVEKIKKKIASDPIACLMFEDSLLLSGADLEHGNLEVQSRFVVIAINRYLATAPDFPKLIKEDLPEAVVRAKYSLSLPALEQWKIE